MTDARTLLRAKRQEAKISHPYASYTSSGQIRCTACGTPVKSSAMWEGHLGSKVHRVAIAKEKSRQEALERQMEMELTQKANGKRKAVDEMDIDTEIASHETNGHAKKLRKSEEPAHAQPSGFPLDFFSDPSKAPTFAVEADDEEEGPSIPLAPSVNSQLDQEWEQFQASMLSSVAHTNGGDDERLVSYDRATVAAEPELVQYGEEGFPDALVPGLDVSSADAAVDETETEEEKQQRKEKDERELIMDRLIEEERAQEEADERVGLLKARIEALKRQREARKRPG